MEAGQITSKKYTIIEKAFKMFYILKVFLHFIIMTNVILKRCDNNHFYMWCLSDKISNVKAIYRKEVWI